MDEGQLAGKKFQLATDNWQRKKAKTRKKLAISIS